VSYFIRFISDRNLGSLGSLLPVKLRGLSSCVEKNVEIPVSSIFVISDNRKVCRKSCRDFVSTREFCKETITTICVLRAVPGSGKTSNTVSRSPSTKPLKVSEGLETDKSTVMLCGRLDEETTANTTKILLINFDCENNL
jgi:hypothetical protein